MPSTTSPDPTRTDIRPSITARRYTRTLLAAVTQANRSLHVSRPADQARRGFRRATAAGLFVLHGPDLSGRELHLTLEHDSPPGAFLEPESGASCSPLVTVTLTERTADGVPLYEPLIHQSDRPRTATDAADLGAALAAVTRDRMRELRRGTVVHVRMAGIPGYQHDQPTTAPSTHDARARWIEDHAAAVTHALHRTHQLRPLFVDWWTPPEPATPATSTFRIALGRSTKGTHIDQLTLLPLDHGTVLVRISRADKPTVNPATGGHTLHTAELPAAAATPQAVADIVATHAALLLPMPHYQLHLAHRGRPT